jgi:membrane-bound metal-dependent hydrolase YbcI (DUF457 family)
VGLSIAWSTQAISRPPIRHREGISLAFIAGVFAIAPDFDFIYPPLHRRMTHSIVAVAVATIWAAFVAHRAKQERPWVIAMVCGVAYASHLALDWLGGDTKQPAGIQLLWPFSDEFFISSWHLFAPTLLGGFFRPQTMAANFLTLIRELAILSPFAAVAWLLYARRRKPASRAN